MTGETLYTGLLRLYPKPFRLRFGQEMLQFYRDCGPYTQCAAFWLETVRDILFAVPREWRREIVRPDSKIDYDRLGNSIMVFAVAGFLLLGWGWMGTLVVFGLDLMAQEMLWTPVGKFLLAIVTLSMGVLVGVVSAGVAARTGRIDRTLCWKREASERRTAR